MNKQGFVIKSITKQCHKKIPDGSSFALIALIERIIQTDKHN